MEMMELPTPETDALDCELHNPRVLQDRYSEMMEHARKLERERNSLQDQRDFCMGEIEWLRKEHDEANRELHKQLEKYDALFDEAEKIRMDRDTYLEAYSRLQLNLLSR